VPEPDVVSGSAGRTSVPVSRDDRVFLAFGLVASTLFGFWYLPLGLVTICVFTVAAWWRRRHPTVRWVLTLVTATLLVGVFLVACVDTYPF
jgi:hypothetical protein